MAASLAGLAFVLGGDRGEDVAPALLQGEITTGAGELTTVTLADGTGIRIGPSSRLRLRTEGGTVVAELEGRAFFAVRTDSARAFVVKTAAGDAIVRGTRFEVRSEREEFRVLVVEGRVRVATADSSVELGEARLGRLAPDSGLAASRVEDVYAHLAWMGNALVFQNTPLPRALDEIERRLGVDVVLEDAELEDVTVTATFTDQTVDEVILVLCGMLGAECLIDGRRAVIAAPSHARVAPVP